MSERVGEWGEFGSPARRSVILVASADAAVEGREAVSLTGGQLVDQFAWDEVAARLETRLRIDTVLVEARGASDDMLAATLPRLHAFACDGETALVVALGREQIDLVASHLLGERTQLLCEPTMADRVAALALADARTGAAWFDDARRGSPESDRLRRLNEEVARIAETLAQLTRAPVHEPQPPAVSEAVREFAGQPREPVAAAAIEPVEVRKAIRARRLRDGFFSSGLFEDPAWDMLLDLFAAELEKNRVSVSSLCIAAAVAPTTALRWISKMVEVGLFERHPDPLDRRRAFMVLSPLARGAMAEYFAAISRLRLTIA
jgi:hypothetical protein